MKVCWRFESVPVIVQNKTKIFHHIVLLTQAPSHWIFMKHFNKSSAVIKKKKKMEALFFLLLLSSPKPLPVVTSFDVKDDRTAFSCDFTEAFVLSFLSRQWRSKKKTETETRPKPFLSFVTDGQTQRFLGLFFLHLNFKHSGGFYSKWHNLWI